MSLYQHLECLPVAGLGAPDELQRAPSIAFTYPDTDTPQGVQMSGASVVSGSAHSTHPAQAQVFRIGWGAMQEAADQVIGVTGAVRFKDLATVVGAHGR